VIHCLLIELPAQSGEAYGKLALLDSGLGAEDMRRPLSRLGWGMALFGGASKGTTALEHVRRIGAAMSPPRTEKDVAHIIMTHLDKDHTGGLADFPNATVHVHRDALGALSRVLAHKAGAITRHRYARSHFAHGPHWKAFEPPALFERTASPSWRVSAAARFEDWLQSHGAISLPELPETIQLLQLPGHAPGHCGVAINTAQGWLLHCGDSVYHRAWLEGGRPPLALQAVEALLQHDARERRQTRETLLRLMQRGDVRIVSSHDPQALAEATDRASNKQMPLP
jgi:glyoxylase-like metal-dependent hydrolase (beta-lactamase superfamily II)